MWSVGQDEHPEKSRVTNLEDWIKEEISMKETDRVWVQVNEQV